MLEKNYIDNKKLLKKINIILGVDLNNDIFLNKIGPTDNLDEINKYLPIIIKVIKRICLLIENKRFSEAYDLVDAIHCLPEALLSKKTWHSKEYWRDYIYPYRKKWNNNFLYEEEQNVVKYNIVDKLRGFFRHLYK